VFFKFLSFDLDVSSRLPIFQTTCREKVVVSSTNVLCPSLLWSYWIDGLLWGTLLFVVWKPTIPSHLAWAKNSIWVLLDCNEPLERIEKLLSGNSVVFKGDCDDGPYRKIMMLMKWRKLLPRYMRARVLARKYWMLNLWSVTTTHEESYQQAGMQSYWN
jgi:hypothetical protein